MGFFDQLRVIFGYLLFRELDHYFIFFLKELSSSLFAFINETLFSFNLLCFPVWDFAIDFIQAACTFAEFFGFLGVKFLHQIQEHELMILDPVEFVSVISLFVVDEIKQFFLLVLQVRPGLKIILIFDII